jgi:hypothetical protein
MELLLNLIWLLMALPAYYLWCNASDSRSGAGRGTLQCVLALGCGLVLLFPVVSATDDLHAMRAEMEESSKRGIRHTGSDKSSGGQSQCNASLRPVAFFSFAPLRRARLEVGTPQLFVAATQRDFNSGRAPPVVNL